LSFSCITTQCVGMGARWITLKSPTPIPDPQLPAWSGVRHVVRLALATGGSCYAEAQSDRYVLLDAAPWQGGRPTGESVPARGARLLPPCEPTKIVCIGVNYADHAKESVSMVAVPDEPILFMKPPSALLAYGATILLPPGVGRNAERGRRPGRRRGTGHGRNYVRPDAPTPPTRGVPR